MRGDSDHPRRHGGDKCEAEDEVRDAMHDGSPFICENVNERAAVRRQWRRGGASQPNQSQNGGEYEQ
jgi:hypothetical protein